MNKANEIFRPLIFEGKFTYNNETGKIQYVLDSNTFLLFMKKYEGEKE